MKKFKNFREEMVVTGSHIAGTGDNPEGTVVVKHKKPRVHRRKYKLLNMSVNEGAVSRAGRFIAREIIGRGLFGSGSGAFGMIARSKIGYPGPSRPKPDHATMPAGQGIHRAHSLNKRFKMYLMKTAKLTNKSELSQKYLNLRLRLRNKAGIGKRKTPQ